MKLIFYTFTIVGAALCRLGVKVLTWPLFAAVELKGGW